MFAQISFYIYFSKENSELFSTSFHFFNYIFINILFFANHFFTFFYKNEFRQADEYTPGVVCPSGGVVGTGNACVQPCSTVWSLSGIVGV